MQVKGKVLIGLDRYLSERSDAGYRERYLLSTPDGKRAFEKSINRFLWYPMAGFVEPLQTYAEDKQVQAENPVGADTLSNVDAIYRRYGKWGALQDFSDYKGIVRQGLQPMEFFSLFDFAWRDNFDGLGEVRVVPGSEAHCTCQITGKDIPHAICVLSEAWMNEFARLAMPHESFNVRIRTCPHSRESSGKGLVLQANWGEVHEIREPMRPAVQDEPVFGTLTHPLNRPKPEGGKPSGRNR